MGHSAVHEHLQTLRRWYKVKRREAPPSQPTCSSGALWSVGCFGCANSRLSSVIAQKQMCAKFRTLPCLEYPYHCLEEDFDEIDEEEYEEYDNDDEYDDGLFDDDFFYFVSDEIYSDFFGDTLEDDFKEDYHYGLLKTNGYSVGKSSGLSLIDRRIILIETYNDELPHDVGLSHLDWGDPRTFVRLKRIADIINFHLQNAKDKSIQVDADVSQSIWDWQNDLAWLKAEFYDSIYDQLFQWPSGQI